VQPSPQLILEHFHCPQKKSVSISRPSSFSPNCSPRKLLTCFLSLWIYLSWTFHIIELYSMGLLCLALVFSSFTHIVACFSTSSLLGWEYPESRFSTPCLSICQLRGLWSIMNIATVKTDAQILCGPIFSLGIPRSRIVQIHDTCVFQRASWWGFWIVALVNIDLYFGCL
jgi:hypothetical protein